MKIRKVFFWLHLVVGLVVGIIILSMTVTGVMLAYERQIIAWAESDTRAAAPQTGMQRLPVEELLTKVVATQKEGTPASVTLRTDPDASVIVSYGREKQLHINAYTGEVLGEGARKTRAFFQSITGWHRWLGQEGKGKDVGKAITGACSLGFFFLVLSGIYLWLPRVWNRAALKPITWFRKGLTGKARDWNWHNTIGLWVALPLCLISLTGIIMSYIWASNLLYRLTGSELPPQRKPPGLEAEGKEGQNSKSRKPDGAREDRRRQGSNGSFSVAGLNKVWSVAEQEAADWQTITLRFGSPVSVMIDRGNGGRPDKRSQLSVDATVGEVVKRESFSDYNTGKKLRMWSRWVHTGEAGGFIGQTIALLAALGGTVLVYTGFALSWRRFFGRKSTSAGQVAQVEAQPSTTMDAVKKRRKPAFCSDNRQ